MGSMPEKVVLYGIEPKTIDTGLELSADVAGSIGRLTDLVADEIRALGVTVTPREIMSCQLTDFTKNDQQPIHAATAG
jgi:hypothetical protein